MLLRTEERSPTCRALLRCASAIGDGFTWNLLRRVTRLSNGEVLDALHEAQRADLILVDGEAGCYRFAHGLVRDVL